MISEYLAPIVAAIIPLLLLAIGWMALEIGRLRQWRNDHEGRCDRLESHLTEVDQALIRKVDLLDTKVDSVARDLNRVMGKLDIR